MSGQEEHATQATRSAGSRFVKRLTDFPFAAVLIVIVIAIHYSPLFLRPLGCSWTNVDWLHFYQMNRFFREAVIQHGQIPLWCQYVGGGFPVFAHPEWPFPSPFVLPPLAFGEIIGLKINAFILAAVGACGTFYLTKRVLRFSTVAAYTVTFLLAFSGWMPSRLASGNPTDTYYVLFPLILGLLIQTVRLNSLAHLAGAALLLALALVDGKLVPPIMIFALVLYSVTLYEKQRPLAGAHARAIGWCTVLAAAAVGLAAVKALPFLVTFGTSVTEAGGIARHSAEYQTGVIGMPAQALWYIMFWPGLSRANHLYLGLPGVLLAAVGLAASPRRGLRWLCLLGLFIWIAMGPRAPLDVFRLLWYLPVFKTISNTTKYFDYLIIFCISIPAALGVEYLLRIRKSGLRRVILALVLAVVLLPPMYHSRTILRTIVQEDMPVQPSAEEFHQVRGPAATPRDKRRAPRSIPYFAMQQNIGVIDWYSPVRYKEKAVPRYFVDNMDRLSPNKVYRGEVYPLDPASIAILTRLTPNVIEVEARLSGPDTIVVNQNFHPGWRCSLGNISERDGLIAITISEPGTHKIRLRFRPPEFRVGAAMSLTTLAILITAVWLQRRRRKRKRTS